MKRMHSPALHAPVSAASSCHDLRVSSGVWQVFGSTEVRGQVRKRFTFLWKERRYKSLC